jgi:hypothetical protein
MGYDLRVRALFAGSLVFVGACAAISGLDDPGESAFEDDAAPPAPGTDGSGPGTSDTGTVADGAPNPVDGGDADARVNCNENGLLARWRFDEGTGSIARDCTTANHDGTITGTSWIAGKLGSGALRFTDDVVDAGNPSALRLTGALTLSAWVNASSSNLVSGRIVSKSSQSDRGWEMNLQGGTTLEFKVATSMTTYEQVAATLTTGQWRHVAGVYAPSTSLRLYVDGTQVSSQTTNVPSSQRNTPLPVLIGTQPGETSSSYGFQGDIDDVRIYSRALTEAEIQALMTAP